MTTLPGNEQLFTFYMKNQLKSYSACSGPQLGSSRARMSQDSRPVLLPCRLSPFRSCCTRAWITTFSVIPVGQHFPRSPHSVWSLGPTHQGKRPRPVASPLLQGPRMKAAPHSCLFWLLLSLAFVSCAFAMMWWNCTFVQAMGMENTNSVV